MENLKKFIENIKKNNSTINLSEVLNLNLTEEEFSKLLEIFKENNISVVDFVGEYEYEEDRYAKKEDSEDIEKMYIRDAKKYRVLTKEEERELISEAQNGDKKALDKLAKHNQRLVMSIVSQCNKDKRLEFLDAIQEGNIGLIRAIRKFDLSTDYKFSTYATWWIKQAISRASAEKSRLIRLPIHRDELIKKMNRYEAEFLIDHKRRPTLEELASKFGVSVDTISSLKIVNAEMASLEAPIPTHNDETDEDNLLRQFIPSDENVEEKVAVLDEIKRVEAYIEKRFTSKEKYVFEKRIIENQTLEEVGADLNVTRERVRQIEIKIKKKLENYRNNIYNDYSRQHQKTKK